MPKKNTSKNKEYLYHYMPLRYFVKFIESKRLVFMNPKTWDDKNDSFSISLIPRKKIRVLCFTSCEDNYFFWKTYAGKGIGVCVEFRKKELLKMTAENVKSGNVVYLSLKEHDVYKDDLKEKYNIQDYIELAFLKSNSFDFEKEFRMVHFSKENELYDQKKPAIEFVDFKSIETIYLSPFLDENERMDLKQLLNTFLNANGVTCDVEQSKITNDVLWRNAIRHVKKRYRERKKN